MARSKKATDEGQAPAEAPKAGRKGKQAAPPAEATPKRGRQKNPDLPQPGTPEYKKAAAERAEKYHEKCRAIRDLTRQYGIGVMELAKYCGFPDERGFRPLGGPEIRALFAQAKAEGKVTHTERPAEEWQVRRGRAKAEGAAAQVKKAATGKKTTTSKAGTKSAGKATGKTTGKKTEGQATPKTGTKGGKRGKQVEEPQGSMSVAEAVNAPFSALREAVADEATGELEMVVVPDEEVYGPGEQPEGTDDMQAEEAPAIGNFGAAKDEEYENTVLYPDKPELDPLSGGTDAEGFFDTKLGQETAAAEDERDGNDELAATTLNTNELAASVKAAFGAPEGNGHDTEKANTELAEWLKAQKPESEKVKLARAFYEHSEAAITSRQAAEDGGVSVQTNHSGRVVELSKAGFVEQAGEDEKKTRTWKITDAGIEAWEEVFGVS